MEDWLDLSGSNFVPVFSCAVRGSENGLGAGISRDIEAAADAISPTEIKLDLTVNLSDSVLGLDLGLFEFVGYYGPAPGGVFALKRASSGYPSSPISERDFDAFARVGGAPWEQEIKYALPRLKEIAAGRNDEARQWLRRMLDRTGDTPEKRALLELLAKP